jgi:hypothetical protein
MTERLLPAVVIALGLIIGSFLIGGRYTMIHGEGDFANYVIRLDRYSGAMSFCGSIEEAGTSSASCGTFSEGPRPGTPSKSAPKTSTAK